MDETPLRMPIAACVPYPFTIAFRQSADDDVCGPPSGATPNSFVSLAIRWSANDGAWPPSGAPEM
jgi:hypothetical protein